MFLHTQRQCAIGKNTRSMDETSAHNNSEPFEFVKIKDMGQCYFRQPWVAFVSLDPEEQVFEYPLKGCYRAFSVHVTSIVSVEQCPFWSDAKACPSQCGFCRC